MMSKDGVEKGSNIPEIKNWENGSLEPDPDLYNGGSPSGSGRVALFAVVIALTLGAVFFALNNTKTVQEGGTPSVTQQK